MFLKSIDIAPARLTAIVKAAEAAARAIPPAFPLPAPRRERVALEAGGRCW